MSKYQYHLQFFGPLKNEYVDWPATAVSVYRITGDQIADRVVKNDKGEVTERHAWSGYLGCFNTPEEAIEAIRIDRETK